jgi:hypothetical protein
VEVFVVGALYATVSSAVVDTTGDRVRMTVLPLTDTPVTVATLFPLKTVNALADGAVEPRVSLNVNVTCEPVPLSATVLNVGGAMSGPAVELFVTEVVVSDAASLPAASWTAALEVPVLEDGAA